MSYKLKYEKYKSKYINFKYTLIGGVGENDKGVSGGIKELVKNDRLLFHGTNLYYIDDIIRKGIDGKYNDTIFDIIKSLHPIIKDSVDDYSVYIDYFINRQEKVRASSLTGISISTTGINSIAEEYSSGNRSGGEGLNYFTRALYKYLTSPSLDETGLRTILHTDNPIQKLIDIYNMLDNIIYHPGIILAFDVDEINNDTFKQTLELYQQHEIEQLSRSDLHIDERTIHFPLLPEYLYIKIKTDNKYIKILLPEGKEYITKLKADFVKSTKKRQLTQDDISTLRQKINDIDTSQLASEYPQIVINSWTPTEIINPTYYSYKLENIEMNASILGQYEDDKISTQLNGTKTKFPHYLYINIYATNINIIINITHMFEKFYEIRIIKNIGIDVFNRTPEFKDKLKLVMDKLRENIHDNDIYQELYENLTTVIRLD